MRTCRSPIGTRAVLLVLVFLILPTLLASCSEDQNPVGFDRSGRVIDAHPREIILPADSSYATYSSPTTGTAKSILVGEEEQTTMNGLFRFDAIPDTTGLARAYLRIHMRQGRGGSIDLNLNRIKAAKGDWSATTVTWETAPTDVELLSTVSGIPTSAIEPDTTDSAAFDVPLDLLRFWKAQPDSNAGFQLAAAYGTGTARIISHNDVLFGNTYRIPTPSLHLVYTDNDREETIVLATADAYVVDDRRPEPSTSDPTAWVSAGPPTRLRLHFDPTPLLTAAPHASIARATLILPVSEFQVIESDPMLLGTYMVINDSGDLATNATDLSDEMVDPFQLEAGNIVQGWVDGNQNHELVVRATDEVSTMEGILFHTVYAAVDTLRPRLRVVYVAQPEPRWPVTP